jgi:predicted transcriptional regulator
MKRVGAIFGFLRGAQPQAEPLTDNERAAVERGEADAAAGRVVPHEEVRRWLRSWGKPDELPAPRWRK